jgi:hypothetical protein
MLCHSGGERLVCPNREITQMRKLRQAFPPDELYKAWVRCQSCIICELLGIFPRTSRKSEAHHAGPRGLGQTADDRTCIPLCWRHHDRNSPVSVHTLGVKFWGKFGLERFAVIAEVRRRYLVEHPEQEEAA